MNCQMFSTGFSSGHLAGNGRMRDVGAARRVGRRCASRPDRGSRRRVRPGSTVAPISARWTFIASVLHHGRTRPMALPLRGRSRRRYRSIRCADRAARGPRAALGPAAGDLVLLADAGFVLEPDFYVARIEPCRARSPPTRRGSFFKSLYGDLVLRVMPRPRRELSIAHRVQFAG